MTRPASPPDPTHVADLDEAARVLNERGLKVYADYSDHRNLIVDPEAVPLLVRLSEQLLGGWAPGQMMRVEHRHVHPVNPGDVLDVGSSIWNMDVVRTKEQAWDWMKQIAAHEQGYGYATGDYFVLDQGEADGVPLRARYTVESGQVISRGWDTTPD